MQLNIKAEIDVQGRINEIRSPKLWLFAASQWHRLITPFTPYRTGTLCKNVSLEAKKIIYNEPYAQRNYHGKRFKFRTDKHPLATAEWDLAAKPTQASKLTKALQGFIQKNKL